MSAAPPPDHQAARLAALRSCAVLDTGPEPLYDDVVALAARICDAPIAYVALVDETRQWLKARVGLHVSETPRDRAFCAHAIQDSEPLIVADALEDPRFHDSPLVLGEPRVRFYAGFPLTTDDRFTLGTLCVADVRPRGLSDVQVDSMRRLARQVEHALSLRRQAGDLAASQLRARMLAETIADGRAVGGLDQRKVFVKPAM
jgi:GAF domain-containing protein